MRCANLANYFGKIVFWRLEFDFFAYIPEHSKERAWIVSLDNGKVYVCAHRMGNGISPGT